MIQPTSAWSRQPRYDPDNLDMIQVSKQPWHDPDKVDMIQTTLTGSRQPWHDLGNLYMIQSTWTWSRQSLYDPVNLDMIQTTWTWSSEPGHDPDNLDRIKTTWTWSRVRARRSSRRLSKCGFSGKRRDRTRQYKTMITPEIVDKIKNGLNKIRMAFKLSIFV